MTSLRSNQHLPVKLVRSVEISMSTIAMASRLNAPAVVIRMMPIIMLPSISRTGSMTKRYQLSVINTITAARDRKQSKTYINAGMKNTASST